MSLPIVAIVGRPQCGQIHLGEPPCGKQRSYCSRNAHGVTRDRSYHEADWNGRDFKIIDTGGIEMGSDDVFQGSITAQALTAADEADVIIFLVDGQTGVNADDQAVANILRRSKKPVLLSVNKLDNAADEKRYVGVHAAGLRGAASRFRPSRYRYGRPAR